MTRSFQKTRRPHGNRRRAEFLDSAPAVILAAAAALTQRIRLTSAVTVLSAADPVRVFRSSPSSRAQFDAMAGPRGPFLIGAPQTVADKVLQASEALGGLSRVTFQMSAASLDPAAMKRSIELLGTEVAPIVRAAARG